jgi:hypothetical protein
LDDEAERIRRDVRAGNVVRNTSLEAVAASYVGGSRIHVSSEIADQPTGPTTFVTLAGAYVHESVHREQSTLIAYGPLLLWEAVQWLNPLAHILSGPARSPRTTVLEHEPLFTELEFYNKLSLAIHQADDDLICELVDECGLDENLRKRQDWKRWLLKESHRAASTTAAHIDELQGHAGY